VIVILAGRRIDAEDAGARRFPVDQIKRVREEIKLFFVENNPHWLVCSGACGADLIALDVTVELNMPAKMILPFDADTFRSTSVTDRKGNWGILFDSIHDELNEKENVIILNFTKDDKDAYEKTNVAILKIADALFKKKETFDPAAEKKVALIIWEGAPKNYNDTTDHFRKLAIESGYTIREINSLQ